MPHEHDILYYGLILGKSLLGASTRRVLQFACQLPESHPGVSDFSYPSSADRD